MGGGNDQFRSTQPTDRLIRTEDSPAQLSIELSKHILKSRFVGDIVQDSKVGIIEEFPNEKSHDSRQQHRDHYQHGTPILHPIADHLMNEEGHSDRWNQLEDVCSDEDENCDERLLEDLVSYDSLEITQPDEFLSDVAAPIKKGMVQSATGGS